ncbi:MAG: ArnT family glycosyltransferase [Planctomycetota bacterium]
MNACARRRSGRSATKAWVGAIVALAAALRLVGLDSVPPALSADEASNAYDGYCLLKTRCDRWGESWPILLRAFGDADYRPALLAYLTVPFHAALGAPHIITAARLPSALCGVLTVLCLYLLARRLFDDRTALWAALLLALSPWHVVMSRLAHESALTPVIPVLILLLLERSGLLASRASEASGRRAVLRWPWALAAGVAVGLSPYSYASTKLFVPALLIGIAILYRRALGQHLRRGQSRRALLVMIGAALVVAGPMLALTVTKWNKVNARAQSESLFHREPTLGAALSGTLRQYAAHFGPDWLFVTGHPYVDQSPRGWGQLNWYMLPLLTLGLVAMVRYRKDNRAYLVVLIWMLLYPIASATTEGGVNAARAACGIAVFPLIGAIGAATLRDRWLRAPKARTIVGALAAVAVTVLGGRFALHYFTVYPRDPEVQARYQTEFRQAMDYLRPRGDLFDHVFVSDRRSISRNWHTSEAYVFPLTYLPIEPAEFHALPDKLELSPPDRVAFHFIARFGDFTFAINRQALDEYAASRPNSKILLIARPGEIQGGRVVHELYRPAGGNGSSGQPCLQLIAADLALERPRAVWD